MRPTDWGKDMLIGHIVQAAAQRTASPSILAGIQETAKEIERLRADLAVSDARVESLMWVLRIVRREINWGPDSPTLRLVEQSIAGAQTRSHVERPRSRPQAAQRVRRDPEKLRDFPGRSPIS